MTRTARIELPAVTRTQRRGVRDVVIAVPRIHGKQLVDRGKPLVFVVGTNDGPVFRKTKLEAHEEVHVAVPEVKGHLPAERSTHRRGTACSAGQHADPVRPRAVRMATRAIVRREPLVQHRRRGPACRNGRSDFATRRSHARCA